MEVCQPKFHGQTPNEVHCRSSNLQHQGCLLFLDRSWAGVLNCVAGVEKIVVSVPTDDDGIKSEK